MILCNAIKTLRKKIPFFPSSLTITSGICDIDVPSVNKMFQLSEFFGY